MRLRNTRSSRNVVDQRRSGSRRSAGRGGGGRTASIGGLGALAIVAIGLFSA